MRRTGHGPAAAATAFTAQQPTGRVAGLFDWLVILRLEPVLMDGPIAGSLRLSSMPSWRQHRWGLRSQPSWCGLQETNGQADLIAPWRWRATATTRARVLSEPAVRAFGPMWRQFSVAVVSGPGARGQLQHRGPAIRTSSSQSRNPGLILLARGDASGKTRQEADLAASWPHWLLAEHFWAVTGFAN